MYCVGKEDEAYLRCEKCGCKVKVGEHVTVYGEEELQRLNGEFYKKPYWYCKECVK